jgi:outer membrane protein assembly factor BamB
VPARTAAAPPSSPAAGFADWPVYHADDAHHGVAASSPATAAAPSAAWTSPALDGDDRAEPIVAGGKVIAVTENDTVYAFDAATGAQVWSAHLGSPEVASALPCGNIDPYSGITGTPVADVSAGLVFAVAFLRSGTHTLYALSLATGAVAWSRPADPPGLNPLTEQQRPALVLANGYVYVSYGGLYGDCGSYHGAVVGIPASGSGAAISYVVPSQNEAGIWAPSGPAVDGAGDLYVATGNSSSSGAWDFANAVIKLSPALSALSSFAPANWEQLNRSDADLGSLGPTLLAGGTLFQAGKSGEGYVISASTLGGVGGQLSSAPVCSGAYGATAYAAPTVYVPCRSGVVAVTVGTGGAMSVAWRSAAFDAGPPIVAGGELWVLDLSGSSLDELNPASGAVVHTIGVPALAHFAAPAASGGLIFVASLRSVEAVRA